jgi:hypothetical protein
MPRGPGADATPAYVQPPSHALERSTPSMRRREDTPGASRRPEQPER